MLSQKDLFFKQHMVKMKDKQKWHFLKSCQNLTLGYKITQNWFIKGVKLKNWKTYPET